MIPWPAKGQAALWVDGLGQVGLSGGTSPAPMASTAKVMTALLVLEDHPLVANAAGPILTVSQGDVNTYIGERNQNESVLPVVVGEQLSEYQLLLGLMLPSASNFAVMLAQWDQGSVPAFLSRMNARAAALSMTSTHYADVSGFSPATVSTAPDLITVARTAMRIPVFAEVVAQTQATLPVAGVIHNLNTLLGRDGVIGIKTGHTDQAGGCLVFAADFTIDGRAVRVYGAVMGQPNFLTGALAAATSLLNALRPALHTRAIIVRGMVVGHFRTAWGVAGDIVAGRSLSWLVLDGTIIARSERLTVLQPGLPSGLQVGTLRVTAAGQAADVPVRTSAPITGPDPGWRLTRGF